MNTNTHIYMYILFTSAYKKELSEKEKEIREFESSIAELEERQRTAQKQLLQNRDNSERWGYRYIHTYVHTRLHQTWCRHNFTHSSCENA